MPHSSIETPRHLIHKLEAYKLWLESRGLTIPSWMTASDKESVWNTLFKDKFGATHSDEKEGSETDEMPAKETHEEVVARVSSGSHSTVLDSDSPAHVKSTSEVESLKAERVPAQDETPPYQLRLKGSKIPNILFILDAPEGTSTPKVFEMLSNMTNALFSKSSTPPSYAAATITGHARNIVAGKSEAEYFHHESARLFEFLKVAENNIPVVMMGAHTLSVFHPEKLFYEHCGKSILLHHSNVMLTWHPVDMIQENQLKKECWLHLQKLIKM